MIGNETTESDQPPSGSGELQSATQSDDAAQVTGDVERAKSAVVPWFVAGLVELYRVVVVRCPGVVGVMASFG